MFWGTKCPRVDLAQGTFFIRPGALLPLMSICPGCGREVPEGVTGSSIRGAEGLYHLPCAPEALVDAAREEWEAILRKGIRYFLGKYASESPAGPTPPPAEAFLEMGEALADEQDRRRKAR